jgi:isoleucyl-tRNA synthetase
MLYWADVQEKPGQGADTLRVWAASVDYTRDVSIGPNAIKHASESLRKVRSAMRFLLANTSGEQPRHVSEVELGPVSKTQYFR